MYKLKENRQIILISNIQSIVLLLTFHQFAICIGIYKITINTYFVYLIFNLNSIFFSHSLCIHI